MHGSVTVTISLGSGVKVSGKIISQDKFCILLENNGKDVLLYKSGIQVICPSVAGWKLFDKDNTSAQKTGVYKNSYNNK